MVTSYANHNTELLYLVSMIAGWTANVTSKIILFATITVNNFRDCLQLQSKQHVALLEENKFADKSFRNPGLSACIFGANSSNAS